MNWILLALIFVIALIVQTIAYLIKRLYRVPGRVFRMLIQSLFLRYLLAVGVLVCLTFGSLVAGFVHYLYFTDYNVPDLKAFIEFEPPTIGHIYDVNGKPIIELAKEYRHIVEYKDIAGLPIEEALLSAEDKDFFHHDGLSVSGIIRAALKNYRSGATMQGGSTITQQIARLYIPELQALKSREDENVLVHNSFATRTLAKFSSPTTANKFYRKIAEVKMAIFIERVMRDYYGSKRRAKEEILARWASYIYLSNGQYGVRSGAEYYFGKKLNELTYDEAAILAGITKSPAVYAPSRGDNSAVMRRKNHILDLMVENGYIFWADAQRYKKYAIPNPSGRRSTPVNVSATVDHTFRELKQRGYTHIIEDIFEGRTEVQTTVVQEFQAIANSALENGLAAYEKRHPQAKGLIQGAVVVLKNSDSSILAMVGGRKAYRGQSSRYTDFNRVTMAKRQPGSAFKPFIYLAAFENGMGLATEVKDSPIKVRMGYGRPPKVIRNYDKKYKGVIPLVQALSESRNAATIWIAREIQERNNGKIDAVFRPARLVGIESPIEPYITTALGATDVTLLELANAYRTFSCGLYSQPHIIQRISWPSSGNEKHFTPEKHMPQISLASMALIQTGLRSIVRLPSGTAHALDSSDFPIQVAGKTGTTTAFKDSIFVGFTYGPDGITVAVRIGFDDPSVGFDESGKFGKGPGRGLGDKETGSRAALPVFREIIREIYKSGIIGTPPQFPPEVEESVTAIRESLTNRSIK